MRSPLLRAAASQVHLIALVGGAKRKLLRASCLGALSRLYRSL